MSAVFYLPCPCGEKVQVTRAQAGQEVACVCGKEIAVPTIRGFASLEIAEEKTDQRPAWSPLRGMLLVLGVLLILASGVGFGAYMLLRPLELRPVRSLDATAADIAVESSLDEFRAQEEAPLSIFSPEDVTATLTRNVRFFETLKVGAMAGLVVGGLLLAGSLLLQSNEPPATPT